MWSSCRRPSRCAGSTLERLEKFQAAGGRVIFAGDVAVCCDAVESDRAKKLAEKSETIPFTRNAVLTAVNNLRDVAVHPQRRRLPDG